MTAEEISFMIEKINEGRLEIIPDNSKWADVDSGEEYISPCRVNYKNCGIGGSRSIQQAIQRCMEIDSVLDNSGRLIEK